ncbi:cytochrome c-type biogenesis protein CcmH [Pelomonas sp. APW6]|uniref:Cytochrome c-type biogenesis protein n=2 Tax=Roseateles subflavus TaxID=3053353 RepID=A0ABT7LFU7_9BURK|nr:cytochrome c-type biogenesis protein [Pelomonas sp. APW6]MDL5031713.1 cytochrome c-type biogenesis protein CcmH [Pelomonas sp. APW6]
MAVVIDAGALEARDAADDPALEARMMHVASALRCLVCQNQTIADSHAGLAVDLRREIREQLAAGRSEAEVLTFMTDRYGDFVLYRPPVDARTWLLWFGPTALLGTAAGGLWWHLRGRSRRPDTDFEADPDELPRAPAIDNPATPPRRASKE